MNTATILQDFNSLALTDRCSRRLSRWLRLNAPDISQDALDLVCLAIRRNSKATKVALGSSHTLAVSQAFQVLQQLSLETDLWLAMVAKEG